MEGRGDLWGVHFCDDLPWDEEAEIRHEELLRCPLAGRGHDTVERERSKQASAVETTLTKQPLP